MLHFRPCHLISHQRGHVARHLAVCSTAQDLTIKYYAPVEVEGASAGCLICEYEGKKADHAHHYGTHTGCSSAVARDCD